MIAHKLYKQASKRIHQGKNNQREAIASHCSFCSKPKRKPTGIRQHNDVIISSLHLWALVYNHFLKNRLFLLELIKTLLGTVLFHTHAI